MHIFKEKENSDRILFDMNKTELQILEKGLSQSEFCNQSVHNRIQTFMYQNKIEYIK